MKSTIRLTWHVALTILSALCLVACDYGVDIGEFGRTANIHNNTRTGIIVRIVQMQPQMEHPIKKRVYFEYTAVPPNSKVDCQLVCDSGLGIPYNYAILIFRQSDALPYENGAPLFGFKYFSINPGQELSVSIDVEDKDLIVRPDNKSQEPRG